MDILVDAGQRQWVVGIRSRPGHVTGVPAGRVGEPRGVGDDEEGPPVGGVRIGRGSEVELSRGAVELHLDDCPVGHEPQGDRAIVVDDHPRHAFALGPPADVPLAVAKVDDEEVAVARHRQKLVARRGREVHADVGAGELVRIDPLALRREDLAPRIAAAPRVVSGGDEAEERQLDGVIHGRRPGCQGSAEPIRVRVRLN